MKAFSLIPKLLCIQLVLMTPVAASEFAAKTSEEEPQSLLLSFEDDGEDDLEDEEEEEVAEEEELPVTESEQEQPATLEYAQEESSAPEYIQAESSSEDELEEFPAYECESEETPAPCEPMEKSCPPNWYFSVKPGYYYLTDGLMRKFFDNGGFTIRGEAGYKLWGPLTLWFDGGYFQKEGHALDGFEKTNLLLATLSLGLKGIWSWNDYLSFYAGAGPRLFLMMLDNDSPHVRSNDNEIGIGGAFDAGFWVFPIPRWKNFFFDLFADYSWKTMQVDPDEISSDDFDVDISGLSFGIGLGIRF